MELQLPQLQRVIARAHCRPGAAPSPPSPSPAARLLGAGECLAGHTGATAGAIPICSRAAPLRDTAIAAIVLVDGQVDHTTGLYMLRESVRPWPIWCTDSTYADLTRGNPGARRAGSFLRRGSAPHRPRRRRLHGRRACRACGGAPCRSPASPRPIRPIAIRPVRGRQPGAGDRGREQRQNGAVRAGLERHRRPSLARHAVRRRACWWTARFGPTTR